MDQVDVALTEAWLAMDRIARDPAELARRRARADRVRQKPVRPWRLAIRAGDTRIDEWGLSWSVNDDAQHGRRHPVEITQRDLAISRPPSTSRYQRSEISVPLCGEWIFEVPG